MTITEGLPETPASATTTTRGAISLVGVAKHFGSAVAVSGIDLEIQAGEFLSLLGPSGCGKTTLLRMLAGFENPTSGDILLDGVSVVGVAPERRPINTVFQSYALFPHMTVAQNVGFGLRQRKVPKAEAGQRVKDALEMVRMESFIDRKPAMLSGGQQQRIALARALACRPDVLLLDEPMSALDRKLREDMQIELKLLQRELGTTFVFVTHDQEEALSMSDRIVVMSNGGIAQVGAGSSIYAEPSTKFVADFIGKQNFVDVKSVSGNTVITDEGEFVTASDLSAISGDGAVVAIRPEALWFAESKEAAEAADNALGGVVSGVSFLGDFIQAIITTPSGHEFLVRGASRNFPDLTEGETWWVTFTAADLKVYAQ